MVNCECIFLIFDWVIQNSQILFELCGSRYWSRQNLFQVFSVHWSLDISYPCLGLPRFHFLRDFHFYTDFGLSFPILETWLFPSFRFFHDTLFDDVISYFFVNAFISIASNGFRSASIQKRRVCSIKCYHMYDFFIAFIFHVIYLLSLFYPFPFDLFLLLDIFSCHMFLFFDSSLINYTYLLKINQYINILSCLSSLAVLIFIFLLIYSNYSLFCVNRTWWSVNWNDYLTLSVRTLHIF